MRGPSAASRRKRARRGFCSSESNMISETSGPEGPPLYRCRGGSSDPPPPPGGLAMRVLAGVAVGLLVLLASSPASAHHAFAVEFDGSKCSDLTGTLTKVSYENPHAYIFVDGKDASG